MEGIREVRGSERIFVRIKLQRDKQLYAETFVSPLASSRDFGAMLNNHSRAFTYRKITLFEGEEKSTAGFRVKDLLAGGFSEASRICGRSK